MNYPPKNFVKTKKYGRADVNNQWGEENGLMDQWLIAFVNRKEISQFSLNRKVIPEDEWIAEAYLETDYSLLDMKTFEKTVREYQAFKMENGL